MPEPNPVRIVRRRNIAGQSVVRAAVITDVLHLSDRILVKPLLIGLANRQNLLLDLESGRVLAWWTGDTARQHTKGKTWMWKPGGENLLDLPTSAGADMLIRRDDQWVAPLKRGQFVTEFEWIDFDGASVTVHYRLDYPGETSLQVTETLEPLGKIGEGRGIRRTIALQGNHRDPLEVRLAGPAHRASQESPALDGRPAPSHQRWTCQTDDGDLIRYSTKNNTSHWRDSGLELSLKAGQTSTVAVAYESALPADQFATPAPQRDPPTPAKLSVAPGFEVTRLPLEMEMMPTAIAWQRDGGMLVSSLKGRVWQIVDRDQDGLEETAVVMADDVAAPFGLAIPKGLASDDNVVDVVTKYALLRLTDRDGDGVADRWQRLASGWGHTADYHDWAIGLPQDEQGRYFLSTACQQDSRSRAAANWRGVVLRLTPPKADAAAATYSMEQLSSGHRFPIGIARNRQGDLFVTDNQGNYNPFNELNHVVKGKHYGFINKLDRKPDHKPPLTPPAVNIPHPWTRSVNGICFLESPQGHAFGPYEGHLVGCEYDTRRLIRMTVEAVDGVLQGAAYPLTRTAESDEPLLGPLCAAVSPQGDLLVGCIRDSGWGGSNNVGTVVRLRPQPDQLGTGIAEVRVASDGLVIQWHGEVDWQQAEDPTKYVLSSFRRVSTPAYGGPDVDRRVEQVLSVSGDRQRNQVRLRLNPLRTGFVYEVRVQNVAKHGDLFPAEAYYTVNRVPSQ